MKIATLTRGEAQKAMEEWIENYPQLPNIDKNYSTLRSDIQGINEKVRNELEAKGIVKRADYYIDAHLGLELYNYMSNLPWFSMRVASNDGFWRYLSVMVVPDIVAQRWGKDNSDHFWSKPTRIWLRAVWWFIHLSWQGNYEKTKELIDCPHFNTDTILNFVERNGRKGTYVEAYRRIIQYYGMLDDGTVERFGRRGAKSGDDLFRIVMKLNTAKLLVMDPGLYRDGEKGYAKALYNDVGVNIDVT